MSIIVTVFNEAHSMPELLAGILGQSERPTEVIVVDAGSLDGTADIVRDHVVAFHDAGIELRLIPAPGSNIAQGRNIAIAASRDDVIAVTDAGCRLDPFWYPAITAGLRCGAADIVGGFFRPVARSRVQRVLAGLTTTDAPPRGFIPSSRSVAFTKALWEQVGRYPEGLRWGEDTLFARRCIAAGRYVVAPDAIVQWAVRSGVRAAARQFYRYALGDGEAGTVRGSLLANQVVGWIAIALAVAGRPDLSLLLIACYAGLVVFRKRRGVGVVDVPLAIAIASVIQCARFAGYLRGWLLRLTSGVRP